MKESSESSLNSSNTGEYLRLSLGKIKELDLPPTPQNYSVFYVYHSGHSKGLNLRLDEILQKEEPLTEEIMSALFAEYVCECTSIDLETLNREIMVAMAQLLGAIVEFAGKAALSNESLESHLNEIASEGKPEKVIKIAGEIIADTRNFIQGTQVIEDVVQETSAQIEKLQEELQQARQEATIDSLTGLLNRRGFDISFQDALEHSETENKSFSLLVIDIDHFKLINDNYGHVLGDKVLMKVGNLLANLVRGNDYIARYGGEEFALILTDTQITNAFTVAEKIRQSIEKLQLTMLRTGEKLKPITVSIGVGEIRQDESLDSFFERCDNALFRAKNLGRNRSVIAD